MSRRATSGTMGFLVTTLAATGALAATYEVGEGQTYANIADAPLSTLGPGDIVLIHYRTDPYRERFGIDTAGTQSDPIVIRGVPGPNGELPIIDAESATTGHNAHTRGLIHVSGGAAYVVVENLELRNANEGAGLQDNSAGIFAPEGSNLTFRNLHIHHCGNGFFSWAYSSDVLVEGCYIHDNGNVGSLYEHNIYTESDGITFQFNVIGSLLSGASGNNLKDRSVDAVIRYNWIEGGNRCLDLVEAEDGGWSYAGRPDFVYGNVLIKHEDTGQSQVVHFGGDNGSLPDRTFLHFFHNTVYSDRTDGTTLVFVNAAAEADVRNNVVYAPSVNVELLDPDDSSQATLTLGPNWVSSGWYVGSSSATVTGTGNIIDGSDPMLAGVPTDFTPLDGSPVINVGGPAAAGASAHPVDLEYLAQGQSVPRIDSGNPDLGAFAFETVTAGAGGGGGTGGTGGSAGAGAGGDPGSGGSAGAGTGGDPGSGGSAGAGTGGDPGAGGDPGTGGSVAATGGTGPATGGAPSVTGGSAGADAAPAADSSDEESGCGCRVPIGSSSSAAPLIFGLVLALLRRRRGM